MSNNSSARVKWGAEVLRVLGTIGKVLLRLLSYFLNILLTVLLIGLITGVIVSTVFAIYVNNYLDLEIDPSTIVTVNKDSATRVYYMKYETSEDRQNRIGTAVEIEDQRLSASDNKIAVSYSQLPKNLINAFVSIEDKRFFKHNGVDWIGTANATISFMLGMDGRGGSTITQQLVKNATGEDEVRIQRKVEEIFRALNLEKKKSKEEILEAYMNIIYLGQGQTGVQQAASYYFGKDVSELSLVECAAIAAIVKNPSQYNPVSHEEDYYVKNSAGEEILKRGNAYRRWVVLEEMKNNGCINEAECKAAQEAALTLVSHDDEEESKLGDGMTLYSWYTEAMISSLTEALMEKYNIERKAASMMIYSNGFKIYTPMDPDVQAVLEEVYTNDSEYFPSTGSGLQPQSACVITDPATNDVLGVVGGRGQKTLNRGTERATQSKRPPGSSIKPLSVYAPALDAGIITYGSVIDDCPVMFNATVLAEATEDTAAYIQYDAYPHNLPDVYMGLTTINSAVTRSVNTVAMKVLQKLTINRSFDFMKNKLGFDSLIESATKSNGEIVTDKGLASLALGQPNYGVTLLEMTAAYEIFPNHGVYNEPKLFIRVEDSEGNVILDNEDAETQIVVKDETASIMTIMLQKVMNEGTGMGCALRHQVNVAGKTGTTSADFDRYFVGYTPYYVCGVWTGYDMNQSLSSFGENPSLIVWDKIMTKLHQKYIDAAANGGDTVKTFETAPGVITATYCKDSGKLCTDACKSLDPRGSREEFGYFTRETVPTEYCETHVAVKRDTSTGLIASPECNPANCTDVALIRVEDRSFPVQVPIVDAEYVYREMPSDVKPGGWWGAPFFVNMLKEGEYCGSSYKDTPYNAYCYKHCDYRPWGGNAPAEDSGYKNPDSNYNSNPPETGTATGSGETTDADPPPEFDFGNDDTEETKDEFDDFWDSWFN